MLIKRLDIIGFKSFPDKCAIEFPPGVSAIVGPNGCGKSNIMDAIKWVMGEQSIKQLRGKAMGDVIFAGAEKRPPLNLAEVSLVLSNDGTEKAENTPHLTEVMITRRIYRSGESVYLINKIPCRLKDIHRIFLGSGMGARSYAFVQQGNIGAITEASPEERRAVIEEAAGVTKYKAREQEAQAKVASTRQNLLRLNDIIEEIRLQMNSLRRQAGKAKRYREIREKVKQADILVGVYHYEVLSSRILETETLLKTLKEKDGLQAGELQKLASALEQVKSDRVHKEEAISAKKVQQSDLQRRIDKLETGIQQAGDDEKRLTEEISTLEAALADLEEKNIKINEEIALEQTRKSELEEKITELESEIENERHASAGIRKQRDQRTSQLENDKQQLMRLMTQQVRFQDIFTNTESTRKDIKQRLVQVKKEEKQAREKATELDRSEKDARHRLSSLQSSAEELNARISRAKALLEEKTGSLGRQVKKVNQLHNEKNQVKSKHAVLKKMNENYDWYKDGVKAVMRNRMVSGGNGEQAANGILGLAADCMEPEPGYEFALEAVLGETLQFILVREAKDGAASINYLRECNAGRSGFIPMTAFSGEAEADPIRQADLLQDHIRVKQGFEKAAVMLLKGVAVVDDFNEALELWHCRNDFRKVVTRNGDLIFAEGIMVGGSKEKLSGIYEKKSELRQMGETIRRMDEALAREHRVQEELEVEVKALETDIQHLTVEKNQAQLGVLEAEKALYRISESLKHARRHLEITELEKDKLAGEKTDVDAELARHDFALGEIAGEVEAMEKRVQSGTDEIAALSDQIREFDSRQVELKLQSTRCSAELENTANILKRLNTFKDEGVTQSHRFRNDIRIKKQKKDQSSFSVKDKQQHLDEARVRLTAIEKDLEDEQTAYQFIEAQIEATGNRMSDARQAIDETHRQLHELELALSKYQINREHVVSRFLEKYSHPFSSYAEQYREMVTAAGFSIEKAEADLEGLKKRLEAIGNVNLGAIEAYEEQQSRFDFLSRQRDDLFRALEDLENVIRKINRITQKLFMDMFTAVNEKFSAIFPRLFDGGSAWLELTLPNLPLETGVELMIHPPGKKVTRLSLLSGGEKALSAIAFIFSIFLINPASYCLLDEIDASLDEANTYRFNELLRIIGEKSQIIMITHNKRSMEFADVLFGVTMGESGVSRIVSVNIEGITRHLSQIKN